MASMVFSAAGGAAGSALGLPFGATLGRVVGGALGDAIGSQFGSAQHTTREGARLADLLVQTSTYGKIIPWVAGTMRMAGNVVWAMPLKEIVTTTTTRAAGKGGGAGRASSSATQYSYFATCAVAVCEGEIDGIERIWADTKLLDPSAYTIRVYRGSEGQMPDTVIEAQEGVGSTPAYRGMAYVVFEDFPLDDFGNRIPNFSFEVRRTAQLPEISGQPIEAHINAITLIPGSGEWVYDTVVQTRQPGASIAGGGFATGGYETRVNAHARADRTDALMALDAMARTLPNLEWVSVVVCWFGTSLDAASCIIKPGVEYTQGGQTTPDVWGVGSYSRATAHAIAYEGDGPRYGGTPSDASVVRLLAELRARGYKVALYPLIMMDTSGKPWRGDITGSASAVGTFFTKTEGYNAFVQHYASLCVGKVDAFIIGSELKGLTKVMSSTAGVFPAVNALKTLAASARATLGSTVKLTYAADWSEYHHTDNGWYHLDALWADANIDVLGIDAYFPLTDDADSAQSLSTIRAGWTSGEGYDWYYTDPARTTKATLSADYAWKNLAWWWGNTHTQPNGATSAWVANSKPIWFTEIGYPSVDGASNQPNVFYDPLSVNGALPRFSSGSMDILSQRMCVRAALEQWAGSGMVQRQFFWTWDARPYPQWPDRSDVWVDGALWRYGHWLQGKLGVSHLGAVVAQWLRRAGLVDAQFDVSTLNVPLEGAVVADDRSPREMLEMLQTVYGFDLVVSGMQLVARWRSTNVARTVAEDAMQRDGANSADSGHPTQSLAQSSQLPVACEWLHISRARNYQPSLQRAVLPNVASGAGRMVRVSIPLCLSDNQAAQLATRTLYDWWQQRRQAEFRLSMAHADLEVGDRIACALPEGTVYFRIQRIGFEPDMQMRVAVLEDAPELFTQSLPWGELPEITDSSPAMTPATGLVLADVPALPTDTPTDARMLVAMAGAGAHWPGAELVQATLTGAAYTSRARSDIAAIMGQALTTLGSARTSVWDEANMVEVQLRGSATLASATHAAVFAGANHALLGNEIIQFRTAQALGDSRYRLSGLLRGRFGTEDACPLHASGEPFVLLDDAVQRVDAPLATIGQTISYRAVTYGSAVDGAASVPFTYQGRALKPYAPAHVRAVWNNAASSITIRWVRRGRLAHDWRGGVDVPLSEEQERYRLEIYSAGGALLRRVETTTPQWVYAAAEILADHGTSQPSQLHVRLSQYSAQVGWGVERLCSVYVLYNY